MNKKSEIIIEWVTILIIIIATSLLFSATINTIYEYNNKYSNIEVNENTSNILKFFNKVGTVLSIPILWIITVVLFNTISVLIDVDVKDNISKLFRKSGLGLIFLMAIAIIELILVKRFIPIQNTNVINDLNNLIESFENYINIAYILYCLWVTYLIKKIYIMSNINSLLTGSLVMLIWELTFLIT